MANQNPNLLAWLKEFGISEQRAELYLATLGKGQASAGELAKVVGLNRTAIYDNLRVLEAKGLLSSLHKGKQKIYVPLHPKELYKRVESQRKQLKDLLPDFMAEYAAASTQPFVQMFTGPLAAMQVYEDILATTKEEYIYLSPPTLTSHMVNSGEMKAWITRRVEKGIRARSLRVRGKDVPNVIEYNKQDGYLRSIRYLPAQMDLKASLYIYENNIGVISTTKEGVAFIIHSPDLAYSLKQVFGFLWSIGMKD